jgi:hypothetical protein
MNSANKFRVAAIVVAVLTAGYASASFFSEMFSQARPALPADPSRIAAPSLSPSARWATIVSPFRTDLEANYALAVALAALRPDRKALSAAEVEKNVDAQEAVKRVLKAAPSNSDLWLALALLETQRKSGNGQAIESLKMSYFTAPNDAQLMPLRLYTAALSEALSDADLKELARGDVRLMLLRQADLKGAVRAAYQAGSSVGRKFLEEAVQSVDPGFASSLRQ